PANPPATVGRIGRCPQGVAPRAGGSRRRRLGRRRLAAVAQPAGQGVEPGRLCEFRGHATSWHRRGPDDGPSLRAGRIDAPPQMTIYPRSDPLMDHLPSYLTVPAARLGDGTPVRVCVCGDAADLAAHMAEA